MKIEEKTVIKYFDLVLLSDKKDRFFDVYDCLVPKYLNVDTDKNRKYFHKIKDEVRDFGKYERYFNQFGSGALELTPKGKAAKSKGGHLQYLEYIVKKDLENKIEIKMDNVVNGDNYGIQSSNSVFKNPIIKNTQAAPISNPETQSKLKKFFSNGYVIAAIFFIIEEISIGKIWKFIFSCISDL